MSRKLFVYAALLSLVFAMPAGATIITIDDFNSDTLNANWVQSSVLNNSQVGTYAYETTTHDNELTATMTGYTGTAARQEVLLRNDYHLNVGETLLVDLAEVNNWTNNSNYEVWGGLAIALQTGITSRVDYLNIAYREKGTGDNKVYWYYFPHTGTYSYGLSGNLTAGSVDYVYITRQSENVYDLGYHIVDAADRTVLKDDLTMDASYALGNAIGIFTDLRTNGIVMYDNFRKEVVPEPSTLAMLAAGLVGLLAYAWRKRK